MTRILADENCTNQDQIYEEVGEASLLFKENKYMAKKWQVDVPTTGFANFLPFWVSNVSLIQNNDLITPNYIEIEKFIGKIMN